MFVYCSKCEHACNPDDDVCSFCGNRLKAPPPAIQVYRPPAITVAQRLATFRPRKRVVLGLGVSLVATFIVLARWPTATVEPSTTPQLDFDTRVALWRLAQAASPQLESVNMPSATFMNLSLAEWKRAAQLLGFTKNRWHDMPDQERFGLNRTNPRTGDTMFVTFDALGLVSACIINPSHETYSKVSNLALLWMKIDDSLGSKFLGILNEWPDEYFLQDTQYPNPIKKHIAGTDYLYRISPWSKLCVERKGY